MRLIDGDRLQEAVKIIDKPAWMIVRDAPTLTLDDIVVHCRDCAVPHNKWTGCPLLNGLVTPPNFYCAMGEKKK